MNLVKPMLVVPGVYQLRAIGARVTLLMTRDGVVLVDAGGLGSLRLIAAGLGALHSSLEEVRLVVLTHYHPDHAGGLPRLVESTPAKVAVHQLEAGILNGSQRPPSPYRAPLLARVTQPFLPLLYGQPVQVDYSLEDGTILPFGEEVRVIHMPGHTPGSICLFLESQGLLIVGDALRHRGGRLLPPASAVTLDPVLAVQSLEKLLSVPFDTMCFSHFPPYRRGAREALQRLLQELAA